MEINAINLEALSAAQTEVQAVPAVPEAADVEAFTRSLFGKTNLTPEEIATAAVQEKSLVIGDAVSDVRYTIDAINDPATMRTVASALSKQTLEVDFIAKVAGSLAQGINKLSSMQ
ncbi:type III secretion system inner rod subunit SctI [Pantoea cypripedii]|jgi:type III secretion system YscI/HrpB-like protein|uniref:EscI/YscI/HrpB family type III secretion system inner rod protein n=1 Tax=Pantoea cypripedii TaxID=55209 RepID=A0A6B9GG16_PANCY|nr:type III secretion system inner rod subunit SctI [Pantoea cypripedii]QGY32126.1 EscI/YscI/HrpB family type III secretion system inner rod protein [Pantoea cypripedii]